MPRRLAAAFLVGGLACAPGAAAGPYDAAFRAFLDTQVVPQARAAGVSEATLARELAGLVPDTSLPGLGKPGVEPAPPEINFQAEFTAPASYFRESRFTTLVRGGRALMARHADLLARVAATGVPAGIVMAVWARESAYGRAETPHDAVQVLATRAFMGARRAFFRDELVAALRILDTGAIGRATMTSSWAGAMGQPQFLPSSYLQYAADFDGDGRRDIWTSLPDVLASIAGYLQAHGWDRGRPWGFEVTLPPAVSCAREGPDRGQSIADWAAEGVARPGGRPFPAGEMAKLGYLLLPAGRLGPAFLVTENFYVLKAYNTSDTYALFVGHLADRYASGLGFAGAWRRTPPLTRGAVRDLQVELEAAGYDVGGADGLIGYKTRRSIGERQKAAGRAQTCWVG